MSDQMSREQASHGQAGNGKAPAGATTALVFAGIALAVAAVIASVMGRFLSYGGLETTKSAAAFNALMGLAVFGPFMIATVCIVWGIALLNKKRHGAWTAGVGIVAIVANFYVVAAAIGS